jgi:hypothetical protein
VRPRDGHAWPAVDESPCQEYPPALHDRGVCAVLRYVARARLGHVAAWDLAAALGLDVETAVTRASAVEDPQS